MNEKGAQKGEIMDAEDKKQYDSPEVLANATKRLTELGGNPPPVVEPVIAPEDNEKVDDNDATSTTQGDNQDDSNLEVDNNMDDNKDDDVSDSDDIKDDEQKEAVTIPDKLFRAATHNEWTPAEIVDFWKSNPDKAKKVLERMHKDMVSINNQYAEHGRAAKQLEAQKAALQTSVAPVKPKDFVDIKAAEEEFGEGAAAIIKKLNDALVNVTTQQQVQQPQQVQQVQTSNGVKTEQNLAVVQQMGHWFADPGLKPYEEFYGDSVDSNGLMLLTRDHLTPIQRQNREKLLDTAGDIEAGVALRAGTISVADALTRAHIILTQDMQTEIIRKGIMKKVKKRAKGTTLRPSGSVIKSTEKLKPGEKISEKQVNINASRRLAQLAANKPMT